MKRWARSLGHSKSMLGICVLAVGAALVVPFDVWAAAGNVPNGTEPDTPLPVPHLRYQMPSMGGNLPMKSDQPVDIVFAIDNTGSMGQVISTVKNDATLIAGQVRAQFSNTTFGSIKFMDYGGSSSYITEIVSQPSLDVNVFDAGIDTMGTYNGAGGDTPEAYVETVLQGVDEITWRAGALHLLVVIGDAPPHDAIYGTGTSGSGHTWAEAASSAVNAGAVVSMVAVGYGIGDLVVYNSYNYMADATGGVYVESSTPSEVSSALIALINSLSAVKPMVLSTTPVRDAVDVPVTTPIEVVFNMDMDPASFGGGTTYLDAGTYCVEIATTYASGTRTLSIVPAAALQSGHPYTVVLGNGIRSLAGETLSTYQWPFTTVADDPLDRAKQSIQRFSSVCGSSLTGQRDLAARMISQAAGVLNADEIWDLGRDLVDMAVSWQSSGVIKAVDFGTSAALSKNLAEILSVVRDVKFNDATKTAEIIMKLTNHAQAIVDWSANLDDYTFVQNKLENDYAVRTVTGISHDGLGYFRQKIANETAALLAALPATITEGQAKAIVSFLERQTADARRAAGAEVLAVWCAPVAGCTIDSTRPLGHIASYKAGFDSALLYMAGEDAAKVVATITKTAGAILKAGSVAAFFTGVGTAPSIAGEALGEKLYWGTTVAEWAWQGATTLKIVLSPRECVKRALCECMDGMEDEGALWADFAQNTLTEVGRLAGSTSIKGLPEKTTGISAIELTDVSTPNISDTPDASNVVTLQLHNSSASDTYLCSASGVLLGPEAGDGDRVLANLISAVEPLELAPGASQSLDIPCPGMPLLTTGLSGCTVTVAVSTTNMQTNERALVGPKTATFYMFSDTEAAQLSAVATETVIEGTVTPGDRQELQIALSGGWQTVTFSLFVNEGANADLHLFDPSGEHTGMDYASNTIQTGVANSSYSGADMRVQSIRVDTPAAGTHVLRVVGRSGVAHFAVTRLNVPVLPAILSVSDAPNASGVSGENAQTCLSLAETGGGSAITDVQIAADGALDDGAGHLIAAAAIAIGLPASTIPKGEGMAVPVSISIPSDAAFGTYSGTLTVQSSAGSRQVSLRLSVEASIPSVVGMPRTNAENALTSAGLAVGVETEAYSDTVAVGSVISQNPAAGASVAPGSPVNLTISKGSDKGALIVNIAPAEVVAAGAQWSLDAGATWRDSGETVSNLPAGSYTLHFRGVGSTGGGCFEPAVAWTTPPDQAVDVVPGDSTVRDVSYVAATRTLAASTPGNGDWMLISLAAAALATRGVGRTRRPSTR